MNISDEAYKYLYIQRGEVSGAAELGRFAWESAYEASLYNILANIMPVMPPQGQAIDVLDVGGGLGGIGVLLSKHYKLNYEIIDGMMDDPEVIRHNQTFSNHVVARNFQKANGFHGGVFHPTSVGSIELGDFDVIMSFAAWCFHIEPGYYLPRIKQALRPETKIILDVRKGKIDWYGQLVDAFGEPTRVLEEGQKYRRLAWT